MKKGFNALANGFMAGFHVKFENGYTVSVQFGVGNYCENRFKTVLPKDNSKSGDAEIAVIDPDGRLVGKELGLFKDDNVEGWVTPERVLEVMNLVSKLESKKNA